jgi:putative ABC transport system permease protein
MNWWKRRGEQLDDEMRRHIEFEIQENIASGMPPLEARYAALRKFGNVALAKEESREIWGWIWLEHFWQDATYAVRGFAKSPVFTAVALLSLLLGIGISTSLFSVVYGVLIAPYPYAKPNEIWAPAVLAPKEKPRGWHAYSRRELTEIQKLPVFGEVMATTYEPVLMTGDSSPQSFDGVLLTGNAFHFIGVPPLIGRTIQPFDISPSGEPAPVVVLSYRFWQQTFNGNPDAIGKKLVLNDVPHTVIGVMPPRFGWYTNDAFWLPIRMDLADESLLNVIMRLKPGVSKETAEQQLQNLNLHLAVEQPQNFPRDGFRTQLRNYMDITTASGEMSSSLHLLSLAVGFLLLIACVNVANLQLARTTTRRREIAVRLSLGAGRARLIRQLLTENVLLSLFGGALGIAFALGATRLIAILIPQNDVPNEARITVNSYVLLFSFAVSVLTGILFGLAPAIRCSRPDLAASLKDGSRGMSGSIKGQAIRTWLVVAEVALSVILLAGAVLAIRSFTGLLKINPGFQPQRTLMLDVPLDPKRYQTFEQRNTFDRELLENVINLPGVESAAIGNGGLPFGGPRSTYSLEGQPAAEHKRIVVGLISSEYLQTLGIPLKRGRQMTMQEARNADHLAMINDAAAKLWAGEDPLGRRIKIDLLTNPGTPQVLVPSGSNSELTIVGIMGDTKNQGLRDVTLPAVFVPYTLLAPTSRRLAIRTTGEPLNILNAVRQRVTEMDKQLPLGHPITLQQIIGFETVEPRFNMALFSCFAGLGLALAAAGIYSVISYDVAQRTHEIGVRLALGASRRDVLTLVLRMVAKVAALGLVVGLCGSVILERVVRFQVFAATSFDVPSAIGVVALLFLISLLAGWLPAVRAGRVEPLIALRHEA